MTNKKQSLIKGALTGSAGIFFTKLLGLLYVVPLNAMATTTNMAFYSAAYTYYDLLLNVCIAGIPFAVATMVAKYLNRKDYQTVLMIRKLSSMVLFISGIIVGLIFFALAHPLAYWVMGAKNALENDVKILTDLYRILSLAIVAVSSLSAIRGFYQGLKDMKVYAFSQVIEQVVRISFMLIMGFVVVYFFKMDRIYVIYMCILAAFVAAFVTIIYMFRYDRIHSKPIKKLALAQTFKSHLSAKDIIKELYYFGLPFLLVVILGSSMNIVNTNFFFITTTEILTKNQAKEVYGIIQVNANKLTSIPQTLALGFSTGLVPYITEAFENKNYQELRKNILDIFDTVIYICFPLSFCLLIMAGEIYYVMYGVSIYGQELVAWSSLLAITGTISPICSSLMMTLRLRKANLVYIFVGFIVKLVSFFILIKFTGYTGAITSSVLSSLVVIVLCLRHLSHEYQISYKRIARRFLVVTIGLFSMNGVLFCLKSFGFIVNYQSKLQGLVVLAIYGILLMTTYLLVTSTFNLPQRIFKVKSLSSILRGRRR